MQLWAFCYYLNVSYPDNSHAQTQRPTSKNENFGFKRSRNVYTLKKTRFKITQLEKVSFIKVDDLKLTQVEFLSFSHFMCGAANASEIFCMAHLANIEHFLYHSNLSF